MRFHLKWVSPSRPYPPAIPDLQGLKPSTCSVQKNSLVQIAAQRALWRGWGCEGDTHFPLFPYSAVSLPLCSPAVPVLTPSGKHRAMTRGARTLLRHDPMRDGLVPVTTTQ